MGAITLAQIGYLISSVGPMPNMYRKEHESKALFIDPKAPKKPIGNQRIRQKAPTQCVERKKGRELCNDSLTLGRDFSSGGRLPGRTGQSTAAERKE